MHFENEFLPEKKRNEAWPTHYVSLLALLLVVYLLPGLSGHDPWKAEDASAFGVIYDMLVRASWLTPSLANQAYPHPPLYFWIAAWIGQSFTWLLPLHDASRLSSGLFTSLIFAFTYLAARALQGREHAIAAPLILAGSIGFLVHAHQMQAALCALSMHCATYWGLAWLDRKPVKAATILSLSFSASLLSSGLLSSLLLLPSALLMLALSNKKRRSTLILIGAITLAALSFACWLFALQQQAPHYLNAWWLAERANWDNDIPFHTNLLDYLNLLPWYAWPALPLSGWTLWIKRRSLKTPALALPLFAFLTILLGLCLNKEGHSSAAIFLLPPLALLSVPGIASLRRGATNALDWFGTITFTLLAIFIWCGWSAMVFGWPNSLARQVTRLEPGFTGQFFLLPFFFALLGSAAWLLLITHNRRAALRSITRWTAGVSLFWLLANTLWLPWVDYGKTYRPMANALRAALPTHYNCLVGVNLSPSLRASLDYFAHITPLPKNAKAAKNCDWLLTQGTRRNENAPGKQWEKTWESNRPGDRTEKFRLYQRRQNAPE